ncbi:glutamate-1-semialdehyde-2,1-aminomutase [Hibiscus trionum]|uniref:Glutamate-1-semialdehyde-2,1-aminomutase n=1 Tax=Hibiscus trionum TaxID=183268 RepID=A0A9W7LK25_HIBTR|nr:glutamate-1-semialdehyde-2,1-aminomutase [Hibiscus trionum]
MAALINGIGGVGFGCQTCCSELLKTSPSPSRSSYFRIRMSLSADDKQTSYTLRKSQEAFNAAMNLMPEGVNSPVRAFKYVGGKLI